MTLDLAAFRRQYITGWGSRMTVGVTVADLAELIAELEKQKQRAEKAEQALDAVFKAAQERSVEPADLLTAYERENVEGLRGENYPSITSTETEELLAIIDRLAPEP